MFLHKQGSKDIEDRSPEKEKRKAKVRGDERKERKMSRKRVSCYLLFKLYRLKDQHIDTIIIKSVNITFTYTYNILKCEY